MPPALPRDLGFRRRPLLLPWLLVVLGSAVLVLGDGGSAHASPPMPTLERVQGDVTLLRAGEQISPTRGVVLLRRDRLLTGPNSRAAVLFPDGSRLLMGSGAEVVLDDFLPAAGRQRTTLRLDVPRGPFRLMLAEPADPKLTPDRQVQVRTASATLMLKAGDLWGGPIDGSTGVLAIYGKVQVRNDAGSLVLDRKRQGTVFSAASVGPGVPAVWPRQRVEQALSQVAFD